MMRKSRIPEVLEQELNFDKFYSGKFENELKDLPAGYEDEREWKFYNGDLEFMKHHKRTRDNMHSVISDLIRETK
jgi:hypothetical protein